MSTLMSWQQQQQMYQPQVQQHQMQVLRLLPAASRRSLSVSAAAHHPLTTKLDDAVSASALKAWKFPLLFHFFAFFASSSSISFSSSAWKLSQLPSSSLRSFFFLFLLSCDRQQLSWVAVTASLRFVLKLLRQHTFSKQSGNRVCVCVCIYGLLWQHPSGLF